MKSWLLSNSNRHVSLVFLKSFFVHSCNCYALLSFFAVLTQISINPLRWLSNLFLSSLPWALFPCCILSTLLQFFLSCIILKLMNFKPSFFVRAIDKVAFIIRNIVPGILIPILNGCQTYLICFWFATENASNTFILFSCILSSINGVWTSYRLFFTDFGLCLKNQAEIFRYTYTFSKKEIVETIRKFTRINACLLITLATLGFSWKLFWENAPVLAFFSPESGFMDIVINTLVNLVASVIPVILNNGFIFLFKSWNNEPINVKTIAYKDLEAIIFQNLKSESEAQRSYSLLMLKDLLATSSECRKLVFQIVGKRNNSLLWTELVTLLLTQMNEFETRLKTFRFYVKKLSLQHDMGIEDAKLDNKNGSANNFSLDKSFVNFSLPKKSEDLEETSVELDLNKSFSMSIFSSQVADPFIPWANIKSPAKMSYGLNHLRSRIEYPGFLRKHRTPLATKASTSLLSEHMKYFHKWASSTRLVNYLFRRDLSLMCNDLFCDFETFVLTCELLTLMTDSAVKEDRYGVVQRDLPQIFTQLVEIFVALDQNCKNGKITSVCFYHSSILGE